MRWVLALLVGLAGCGDDSAPPAGGPDAVVPDAPVDAPARDSGTTVDGDVIDASCDEVEAGLCCSRRRIYLNFDGVDVIADGAANDARSNRTFLIMSNKTVPPFLSGMANRDAVITAIVTQLGQQLAGFDVELTRTRPGSGDYMMVIFGGDSGNLIGMPGFGAYGPLDCGNASRDDLMFVFDSTNAPALANSVMFVLGISMGLSTSTLAGDCLAPTPVGTPCTLSATAPVDMTRTHCPNAPATQDEPAAFRGDLVCR